MSQASKNVESSPVKIKEKQKHFYAIDLLRVIAIVGIVLYHTRPSLLKGGFIFVSVFFVISGFFVTRAAMNFDHKGVSAYFTFIFKRIVRILIPVLALIACVLPLSWLVAPSLLPKAVGDSAASATLTLNWFYIFRHQSYFQAFGLPSPLTHLWFVALLMQFTVAWPPFVRLLKRCKADTTVQAIVYSVIILTSFITCFALSFTQESATRIYYGTDTRLAELVTGALAAVILEKIGDKTKKKDKRDDKKQILLTIISLAGIALLIVFSFILDGSSPYMYRGGFLLCALVTAAIIVCSHTEPNLLTRIAATPLIHHISACSFALYLVHYPLFEFLNPPMHSTPLRWWEWIIQFAVVILCAEVFHHFVVARRTFSHTNTKTEKMTSANPLSLLTRTAKTLSAAGIVVVLIVTFSPIKWTAVSQNRSQQLRPEIARLSHKLTGHRLAPHKHKSSRKKNGVTSITRVKERVPDPVFTAIAQKAPENLNVSDFQYSKGQTCNANAVMIGDSVILGAKADINQLLPHSYVDAQEGRPFIQAISQYRAALQKGYNPKVTVFALGTNGPMSKQELNDLITSMKGEPMYLVTERVPQPWQNPNNALIRKLAAQHSNVGIIDWLGTSEGHTEYLYDDATHLTPDGRYAYAVMVRNAVCGIPR